MSIRQSPLFRKTPDRQLVSESINFNLFSNISGLIADFYYCKYRHFLTSCEGAGTNSSLRERRHEHIVRFDEEELPTAAFMFMNVTVLEELRVFGVVAVAPVVEHVVLGHSNFPN